MKYLTCEKIRELDRMAIEDYGIPGIILMENASLRFFDVLSEKFSPLHNKKVTIVCGSGNNGGDGFAIARHVYNNRGNVTVLYTGSRKKIDPASDTGINYSIASGMGIRIIDNIFNSFKKISYHIKNADIVIDAVFGTGLSREVRGDYAKLLETLSSAKTVASVDIPSGLDGNTGIPRGTAVKADLTVTFAAAKKGFRKKTAKQYTGEIRVVDISIPISLF